MTYAGPIRVIASINEACYYFCFVSFSFFACGCQQFHININNLWIICSLHFTHHYAHRMWSMGRHQMVQMQQPPMVYRKNAKKPFWLEYGAISIKSLLTPSILYYPFQSCLFIVHMNLQFSYLHIITTICLTLMLLLLSFLVVYLDNKRTYSYMKPLLTQSRPTLLETLPVCCNPIARLLTTTEQLTQVIFFAIFPFDWVHQFRIHFTHLFTYFV